MQDVVGERELGVVVQPGGVTDTTNATEPSHTLHCEL
jgi:hypothetical protein